MKKIKFIFCSFLFVFLFVVLKAQITDINSTPKDSLLFFGSQIRNNSFAFLIKEDTPYLCYINSIINLKNGYLINVQTKIDTFSINLNIVTTKKSNSNLNRKIKKNNSYYFTLKRYFEYPILVGFNFTRNKNLLIGDKMVHVAAKGSFHYIFISEELDGLEYLDSLEIYNRNRAYNNNKHSIDTLILKFLNIISNSQIFDSISNVVDTNSAKRMFHQYCISFGKRKMKNSYNYCDMLPDYKIKIQNWTDLGVNPNSIKELINYELKYTYNYPIKEKNVNCVVIDQKILNTTQDQLYTIRVKWKIDEIDSFYYIILTIKQIDNKFIIIGINTVDLPQRLPKKKIHPPK